MLAMPSSWLPPGSLLWQELTYAQVTIYYLSSQVQAAAARDAAMARAQAASRRLEGIN